MAKKRFCVDENLPQHLAGHLKRIYKHASFSHVRDLGLRGTDDVTLFGELAHNNFNALITQDTAQVGFLRPEERNALRDADLHWIAPIPAPIGGRARLANLCGTIATGLEGVLEAWEAKPTIYWVQSRASTVKGISTERL